jgi:orotate phosphoribosyltransferase
VTRDELCKQIYKVAHLEGTFKLRCGQISNEYFDKYLFESYPNILREIAKHLSKKIPEGTEVLAGLEMGGIPIATALSIETGLPVVFVRKKSKEYGTCKLAEGIDIKGKRICIIEDVVTTGGQIIISTKDLKELGAKLENVICVIERNPEGRKNLDEFGLKLISLYTMEELKKKLIV